MDLEEVHMQEMHLDGLLIKYIPLDVNKAGNQPPPPTPQPLDALTNGLDLQVQMINTQQQKESYSSNELSAL